MDFEREESILFVRPDLLELACAETLSSCRNRGNVGLGMSLPQDGPRDYVILELLWMGSRSCLRFAKKNFSIVLFALLFFFPNIMLNSTIGYIKFRWGHYIVKLSQGVALAIAVFSCNPYLLFRTIEELQSDCISFSLSKTCPNPLLVNPLQELG